jgi:AcrR family transcriptional regulator
VASQLHSVKSGDGLSRRSRHEVQRLILEAARAEFSEKGYTAATTREIAARAGVHEPMVYRRYGSKAKLYEAAVLVPFDEVVSGYLAAWQAQADAPASLEELVRAFVEPLYALLTEHRDLALALVGSPELPVDSINRADGPVRTILQLLDRMGPQLQVEGARRGIRVSAPITNLVVVGMVAGLALMDHSFMTTEGGPVTRGEITEEMVQLIMRGVAPAEPAGTGNDSVLVRDLIDRLVAAERRAADAEARLELLTSRTPDDG